jgi:hypothetical protein
VSSAPDAQSPPAETFTVDRAALWLGLLLAAWLLGAALTSPFELFDSWDAIGNARYLVGWEGGAYQPFRGELWSVVFTPVEVLRRALDASSADARPFRAVAAGLHLLTFVAVWRAMKRWHPAGPRTALLAGVLASFNVVVALYAPYRSVDLVPGAMLLAMVMLAWRFGQRPSFAAVGGLALIGALGAFTKPILGGLLWLAAFGAFAATADREVDGGRARRFGELLIAAGVGAAAYWLVRMWLLAPTFRGDTLWLAPLESLQRSAEDAYGRRLHHYAYTTWFRNVWAWGGAACVLFALGVRPAWRQRGISRAVLVGWVVFGGVSVSNAIAEVRYLMPLVPLTAWVAAHGVGELRSPRLRAGLAVLAVVDLTMFAWTASGAFAPVTRADGGPSPLVERLVAAGGPVAVTGRPSYVLDRAPPLFGDPYHGLTEARPRHVCLWLDRPMSACEGTATNILKVLRSTDGRLVWTSGPLHHVPAYLSAAQIDAYRTHIALPLALPGSSAVLVDDTHVRLPAAAARWRYQALDWPDGEHLVLGPDSDGSFTTHKPITRPLDDALLRGVAVMHSCDARGRCSP